MPSAKSSARRAVLRERSAPRFALFGETLLVGIVVLVLSVPIVTLLPALVAGAGHLRRHATGESDRVRDLIADFAGAVRRLWPGSLALAGLFLCAEFLRVASWSRSCRQDRRAKTASP